MTAPGHPQPAARIPGGNAEGVKARLRNSDLIFVLLQLFLLLVYKSRN